MTAATVDAGDGLPLTLSALLRARVAERGDAVLLERGEAVLLACDDDVLGYAAAEQRSAALARGLLAAGVGPGTCVGILHPNGSAFVVAWLAAARIGAVAVPLSTFSTAAELGVLLRNADVALLLSAASYRSHDYAAVLREAAPGLDLATAPPLFAESLPALRRIALGDAGVRALEEEGREIEPAVLAAAESAVSPGDRLTIVHTSGSTSEPKGVIHTHGALIRHLDNLNQLRRYAAGEVLFSNSPFFWIGGLAYSLLGTLVAGAKLVCSNAAHAAGVLDVLERERPTLVNGFAQSVAHLPLDPSFAKRDLSSIRRGNLFPILPDDVRPKDPELRHAMLGMTEAGSVCLASDDESDQPERRRGSFGKPAPGFEARIVDGELQLRGPFLMEGYTRRERHESFDADGWYATGDLFVVDDEGFFHFQGRRGDMIKTSGANVSPREVEGAILELTGLVAHVIGIPDPARGQLVAVALRVPAGRSVDEDALREQLAARLSAYKVPRKFLQLGDDAVPLLSSGKLDRHALEALFRAG